MTEKMTTPCEFLTHVAPALAATRKPDITRKYAVSLDSIQANPLNPRSVGERVEAWHCYGLPDGGLSAEERAEVIEDALGSFLVEFIGKTEVELQALEDKELVASHYWAMHEATR